MLIGTSCNRSSRRCAVTTMTSSSAVLSRSTGFGSEGGEGSRATAVCGVFSRRTMTPGPCSSIVRSVPSSNRASASRGESTPVTGGATLPAARPGAKSTCSWVSFASSRRASPRGWAGRLIACGTSSASATAAADRTGPLSAKPMRQRSFATVPRMAFIIINCRHKGACLAARGHLAAATPSSVVNRAMDRTDTEDGTALIA